MNNGIDRGGVMGHESVMRSHRNELGVAAALIAVLLVPMPAPAAATPGPAAELSIDAQPAAPVTTVDAEAPAEAALRTSGTLATIVVITAAVVGLWWRLVERRRRN